MYLSIDLSTSMCFYVCLPNFVLFSLFFYLFLCFQGILATVTAAVKIGGEVDILVAGYNIQSTVGTEASAIKGISNVFILQNKNIEKNVTAEDSTHSIISSGSLKGYSHILAASSKNGKNFFPRLAALHDSAPLR